MVEQFTIVKHYGKSYSAQDNQNGNPTLESVKRACNGVVQILREGRKTRIAKSRYGMKYGEKRGVLNFFPRKVVNFPP